MTGWADTKKIVGIIISGIVISVMNLKSISCPL